jgi:hypothetical protein
VLGYGDHASGNDVMTTALQAGVQRLPGASGSGTTVLASSAVPQGSTVLAGVTVRASLSGETTSALGVNNAGVLPAAAGVLLDFGPQAPVVVSAATAVPAAVPGGPDRASASVRIPGQRPPNGRAESSGDGALPDEARDGSWAEGLVPGADLAGTPFDPNAAALGSESRQRASDACFADGSWLAEDQDTLWPDTNLGRAADAAVVAALTFLSGSWTAGRVDSQPRRRRWLN